MWDNVYVVGGFRASVDFDPGPLVDLHVAYGNLFNTFLTKLTGDGAYLWTKSFSGKGETTGSGLAMDGDGNLFIVGGFGGVIDFDPGPGVNLHSGNQDVFVTKLDAGGNHLWTRTFGGSGYDYGTDVAVDAVGGVYVTGRFRGRADFDPGPGTDWRQSLRPPLWDQFLTKLRGDGSYAWTAAYPIDGNTRLTVHPAGDVVLTASFRLEVDFDPSPNVDLRTPVRQANGSFSSDLCVIRLHPDGSYAWTYAVGGTGGDRAQAAVFTAEGGLIVAGFFQDTVDFDPGPSVAERRCSDLFCECLIRLGPDGSLIWALGTEAGGGNTRQSMLLDAQGDLYYTRVLQTGDVDPTCGYHFREAVRPAGADSCVTKLGCSARPADGDDNGVVDLRDVARYQNCFTGPPLDLPCRPGQCPYCEAGCDLFDLNTDGAVNAADLIAILPRLTGPQ